jgi:hypothetical protein
VTVTGAAASLRTYSHVNKKRPPRRRRACPVYRPDQYTVSHGIPLRSESIRSGCPQ